MNKSGKAIDCVETASQKLHNTYLVLDQPMLVYERASALMDFILQCADPRPSLIERVKSDLKQVIDQILRLEETSSYQRYLKTHRYAFMKRAMLLLDCRTTAGRNRTVKEEDIKEAKACLDALKKRYWQQTSRGEKIQFYLAQSDLHFRMRLYQDAEEYALEALAMAEEFGFNTEIKLANDRLEDIRIASAHTKGDGNYGNPQTDVYADGNHGKSTCDVCADGDHGNSTCDVSTYDNHSNTEAGSSEGHIGDVSNSTCTDSDWLDSPTYF